jgi:hypothetical protein
LKTPQIVIASVFSRQIYDFFPDTASVRQLNSDEVFLPLNLFSSGFLILIY